MVRNGNILPLLLAVVLIAPTGSVRARQDDPRRAQIAAASSNALERLRQDVLSARISPNLTVEDFIRRTGGKEDLDKILRNSQQIGGPRWIDDNVCQIKLEISGEQAAAGLVEIARAKGENSPLSPEALSRELRGWRGRTFAGTGSSITFEAIKRFETHQRAWEGIDEQARQQVLGQARQDAVRRALDSVREIELSSGLTVGDALRRPQVAQRMSQWFENRPIKTVSFTENLQIDMTLGAPADEAFDAFLAAVQGAPDVKLPQDDQALRRLREQFVSMMAEPQGQASLSQRTTPAPQPEPQQIEIPAQAPAWVVREVPLDAEGTASVGKTPLQVLRSATQVATVNLRAKIGALPLREDLTLDEAARGDPRIARALDRAMVRARTFKVDHHPDGSKTVRVSLDPREVWAELLDAR
jgi:hypothetical protein